MKTPCPEPVSISVGGLRRIVLLAVCVASLLGSGDWLRAGTYTQQPGTNVWNFYDFNGATSQSDGQYPSGLSPFSGSALPSINYWIAPTYVFGPFNNVIPPVGQENAFSTVIPTSSSPTAYASFILGNNPAAAGGLTFFLTNPNSAWDEMRLDWNAVYTYTGPPASTTLGSSPFAAIISGYLISSGSFYALAGGETIYDGNNSTTATLNNGFTTTGLGTGPWNGGTAGSGGYYVDVASASFSSSGLTVNSGDWITVKGYLELVVDPGTIQVQLQSLLPTLTGITTYSNLPTVFYPTPAGTNFVVQTTTNLTTGPWVTVTNGIPISGLIIPNPASPSFYRVN